jgi:O-acetyl-ADP-ribose deacetylase (regulator of RNase III)
MITYLKGDATDPKTNGAKIIAHINNDMGGWGKGFVLALSKKWKDPEIEYRNWYRTKINFAQGNVGYVKVRGDILVANMIAQQGYGDKNDPPIRYEALRKCLYDVCKIAKENEASVHMPRIGCGLAGGKWEIIEPMIEEVFANDVDVYIYDYEIKNAEIK